MLSTLLRSTLSPRKIAEANHGLAWGDSEVAEAWYSRGLRHYREAWDDALDARHH